MKTRMMHKTGTSICLDELEEDDVTLSTTSIFGHGYDTRHVGTLVAVTRPLLTS
jgi:hypothetical protein